MKEQNLPRFYEQIVYKFTATLNIEKIVMLSKFTIEYGHRSDNPVETRSFSRNCSETGKNRGYDAFASDVFCIPRYQRDSAESDDMGLRWEFSDSSHPEVFCHREGS
jgi:hypothetical protein